MRVSTFSKAKVVRNIMVVIILVSSMNIMAQNFTSAMLTYSCKSTTLDVVFDHLSQRTGVYFLYSADKINTKALVTFSVKNKSLNDILALLGKQFNLTFNTQGRKVIVKANPFIIEYDISEASDDDKKTVISPTTPDIAFLNSTPLAFSSTRTRPLIDIKPSTESYLRKKMVLLQPYFDSAVLKKLPASYLRRLNTNNSNPRWFIAGGPMINNYAAGMEFQFGVRQAFVVFNPTWLKNSVFHASYGVGTNLMIKRGVSFSPVYTYGRLTESEVIAPAGSLPYEEHRTINRHAVNFMIQLAVNKNVSLRFGPVFNQFQATYKYTAPRIYAVSSMSDEMFIAPATGTLANPYYSNREAVKTVAVSVVNPSTLRIRSFDIGWQASIQYRLFLK